MGGPTDTPRSEAGGRPHLGSQGKCSGQRPQATPPLLSCPSRPLTQAKASARLCKETPTSKALQLFSGTWPPSPEAPQLSVPGVMAGASQASHGAEPGTCDHLSPGIRDSDLKSCVLFSLIQFTCDNRYKDCSTFSSFPPSPPCTNPKGWGGEDRSTGDRSLQLGKRGHAAGALLSLGSMRPVLAEPALRAPV